MIFPRNVLLFLIDFVVLQGQNEVVHICHMDKLVIYAFIMFFYCFLNFPQRCVESAILRIQTQAQNCTWISTRVVVTFSLSEWQISYSYMRITSFVHRNVILIYYSNELTNIKWKKQSWNVHVHIQRTKININVILSLQIMKHKKLKTFINLGRKCSMIHLKYEEETLSNKLSFHLHFYEKKLYFNVNEFKSKKLVKSETFSLLFSNWQSRRRDTSVYFHAESFFARALKNNEFTINGLSWITDFD